MVFVNSKKFACESCIKGHRSSSCSHTDRPLYEIKKKGRPVSQCEKCRELRQSKRVHSKCTCNDGKEKGKETAAKTTARPPRFRHIAPALPNGLQDVMKVSGSGSPLPVDVRQRVDTLLNPCHCKSVWKCQCRSDGSPGPHSRAGSAGLDALARAAAGLELAAPTPTRASGARTIKKAGNKRLPSRPASPSNAPSRGGCGSCCSSKKRRKNSSEEPEKGPELPPLLFDEIFSSISSPTLPTISVPTFDTMPPMSAMHSIAGTGCTCGITCACPGCVEHRGKDHASNTHKDCADGCGTCVDHNQVELPSNAVVASTSVASSSSASSQSSTNFLDAFFARAASLPQPPSPRLRVSTISLDPTNITIYPDIAFSNTFSAPSSKLEVGRAFGLINVPKLECCGGSCGCPSGMCGCGEKCDGCCSEHLEKMDEEQARTETVEVPVAAPLTVPVRSCCAGKA